MSIQTLSTIVAIISLAVSGADVIAQNGYTPDKKTNLVACPKRVLPGGLVSLIAKLTEGNKPAEGVTVRFYMDGNEIPYVGGDAPETNSGGIAEAGVPVTASAGATVKFVAKPGDMFPQSNEQSVVVVGGIWKDDPNHLYQGFDVLDAGLWDIGVYPWTVVRKTQTTQAAMLSLAAVPDPNIPIVIVSANPATATITPPNTGQKETNTPVTGVAAGETHATAGNPEIARLKLLVKNEIGYIVNFHYAKDGNAPTPHQTSRTSAGETAVLDALAEAWTKQSNAKFTKGTSGELLLSGNWGDVIPANRINELYSKVSPGQGQIAIIFVWACDISKGGVTEGNKCIIKDSASDLVIAHEVGHAMGLTQKGVDCDYPGSELHSNDVMSNTVNDPRVRQFQTQTIHAKYPTGPPKE